jgi:hypothetical protein
MSGVLVELAPRVLVPEDDVSHHIHNVGNEIGLTVHVFGT